MLSSTPVIGRFDVQRQIKFARRIKCLSWPRVARPRWELRRGGKIDRRSPLQPRNYMELSGAFSGKLAEVYWS
jgi:hypothetical protein